MVIVQVMINITIEKYILLYLMLSDRFPALKNNGCGARNKIVENSVAR